MKTATSDEPTVLWREPSDYPVVKFEQDRDAPRRKIKHRMNRRVSTSSSDGRMKPTETVWPQGLQHRMNRQCVSVMRRNSCVSRAATAK
jgi:hypothetical protein